RRGRRRVAGRRRLDEGRDAGARTAANDDAGRRRAKRRGQAGEEEGGGEEKDSQESQQEKAGEPRQSEAIHGSDSKALEFGQEKVIQPGKEESVKGTRSQEALRVESSNRNERSRGDPRLFLCAERKCQVIFYPERRRDNGRRVPGDGPRSPRA